MELYPMESYTAPPPNDHRALATTTATRRCPPASRFADRDAAPTATLAQPAMIAGVAA